MHNKFSDPDNPFIPPEDIIDVDDRLKAAEYQNIYGGGGDGDGAVNNLGGDPSFEFD